MVRIQSQNKIKELSLSIELLQYIQVDQQD